MQFNAMLTALAFLLAAVFVCYSLLKNAQLQEDADDERLCVVPADPGPGRARPDPDAEA